MSATGSPRLLSGPPMAVETVGRGPPTSCAKARQRPAYGRRAIGRGPPTSCAKTRQRAAYGVSQ
jgi:hypothetical protein